MEARITLVYENEIKAKAVSQAISPDNANTPKNLFVKTFNFDNRVVTSVKYYGDNIMMFISTIDDLLSCISIAEMTFLMM